MITTLSVLALLLDARPALWLVAIVPATGVATVFTLLLAYRPAPKLPVWQEGERHLDARPSRWRPAHRATSARRGPGSHSPARGRWGIDRLGRVGEETTSINPAAILDDREDG